MYLFILRFFHIYISLYFHSHSLHSHSLFFSDPWVSPLLLFLKSRFCIGCGMFVFPSLVYFFYHDDTQFHSFSCHFFLKFLSELALFFPVPSKSNYEQKSCQWSSGYQRCYSSLVCLCSPGLLSSFGVTEFFGSLIESTSLEQENTFQCRKYTRLHRTVMVLEYTGQGK